MDTTRDVRQGVSKAPYNPSIPRESSNSAELKATLGGDSNEDDSPPHEHVPFQDDPLLDSLCDEPNPPQDAQAPEALRGSTELLDEVTTGQSCSEEPFEHTCSEQGLRSRQEGVSETPAASDSSIVRRLHPTGKGKEKEIYPLELDLSDDDQHNRGYRRSSDNSVKETTDTVSGLPSLRSRRSSEAADDTPTATSFKERMKSHFTRVKSKDAAEHDAALPTTSSRDLSEEQLELQRSEQQRDVEGFGPGEILSTGLSHSSLSSANRTASQHQHYKDEVCCTCDDKTSRSDRQQPTESKREPWWWVMQTGFYYLAYWVYCDFATAVHNGSQLSRLYGPHIDSGHGSVIMFTTWWQFFRFVLGMMYLGSWLSSGAARLAIGKMTVWVDRDAARQ
ncbi:hypothetical protein N0V85_004893 [Neurospora sp. IMI 360204]|nr:hypothetical protein N0V85_004893 [Neurospora sp. IMI 360204]